MSYRNTKLFNFRFRLSMKSLFPEEMMKSKSPMLSLESIGSKLYRLSLT